MMKKTNCALSMVLLAGAGFLAPADVSAQAQSARVTTAAEARQRDDFARLLESAKGLNQALKRVSEQRKVDYSKATQEADQKIRQAEAAAAENRMLDARLLLEDAYLGSKLAIAELAKKTPAVAQPASSAASPEVPAARQQKEYAARKESTQALRDALERIAQEKNDDKAKAEVPLIDKLMRDADAQVAQDAKRGRAVLDHAYLRAKVQIERLRGGETLVRTLHFDSKGDEYHYEQDRNETYKMLIPMLVPNGSAREAQLKDILERARTLRDTADGLAQRSEFDSALKVIDESTAEYQKAIRNAGVLIPG